MHAINCPPLRVGLANYTYAAAEANALTYLASYASETLPTRVEQSFKRAFGMDSIWVYPRVEGGRPGFVVAIWDPVGKPGKVVVAIEGTTSIVQLIGHLRGTGGTVWQTYPGRVYGIWANYATDIMPLLNSLFTSALTVPRANYEMNFAGFSMGGAIAELIYQYYYQSTNFSMGQLYTFAKPRVGNQRWIENRQYQQRSCNYVLNRDSVSSLPVANVTNIGSVFSSVPTLWTHYTRDPDCLRYDRGGNLQGGYSALNDRSVLQLGVANFVYDDPDGYWADHDKRRYRLMFAHWACQRDPALLYRLLNLEFEGDNSFAHFYQPGIQFATSLFQYIEANDIEREPSAEVRSAFTRETFVGPINTQVPRTTDTDYISGGGVWGGEDAWNVATPTIQRRTIFRRGRRIPVGP